MPVEGALKLPAFTAEVTNTTSFQTMGEDQPRPGISDTQATLLVADHWVGRVEPSATPEALPPRNCGQFTASAAKAAAAERPRAVERIRLGCLMTAIVR